MRLKRCVGQDGTIAAWARAYLERLAAYAEYGPNAGSIQLYVAGTLPANRRWQIPDAPHPEAAIELYALKSFFIVTGRYVQGTPLTAEVRDEVLAAISQEISEKRHILHDTQATLHTSQAAMTQAALQATRPPLQQAQDEMTEAALSTTSTSSLNAQQAMTEAALTATSPAPLNAQQAMTEAALAETATVREKASASQEHGRAIPVSKIASMSPWPVDVPDEVARRDPFLDEVDPAAHPQAEAASASGDEGSAAQGAVLTGPATEHEVDDASAEDPGWQPDELPLVNMHLIQRCLRAGRPTDYIRKIVPTAWRGQDEPAPRFEQFLREIFADRASETRDVLIASGRASTPGSANSSLCKLQGRRIAWASETNQGARFDIGQVKYLTGGGAIAARELYGKAFSFNPSHLLILLTNHKPHADASDAAFWERLCPIIFTQRFVDQPTAPNELLRDTTLGTALKAEASGILAWLDYREEEDTLGNFLRDCCTLDPLASVRASALYATYKAWSVENGLKTLSNMTFGVQMKRQLKIQKMRMR